MRDLRATFILSLPRSGSTLLQRMVGAHPEVATTAEPWILLPLLSALEERGVYASYNHRVARRAIASFTDGLPGGTGSYYTQVNAFAMGLYRQAAGTNASVFLDKTPRYGLYIDALLRTFPDAPMIVLWRNPLAIVASILETWLRGRWMPHLHAVDLYDLLDRLTAAVARQPERFHQIRYEDLVSKPEAELRQVLAHLGLGWDPAVVDAFMATDVQGAVGDKAGVRAYPSGVSPASLDRWPASFASPLRKRWAHRYLDWIGAERLFLMGYDPSQLHRQIDGSPSRPVRAVLDAVDTARGLAWRVLEPQIARDKWAQRRHPERITSHS